MTLHYRDRVPADGTLRCERCGHGIELLDGDRVPRCYCGGGVFSHQPHACDVSTPRAAMPRAAKPGGAGARARTVSEPPR